MKTVLNPLTFQEFIENLEFHTMNGRNYIAGIEPLTRKYNSELEITKCRTLGSYLKKNKDTLEAWYNAMPQKPIDLYVLRLADIPNERGLVSVLSKKDFIYRFACHEVKGAFTLLGCNITEFKGYLPKYANQ